MNCLKKMIFLGLIGLGTLSVCAQNTKGIKFQVSGDFVSSYVWRGVYQGAQACIQPTLGVSAGGFSLTAWGSTSLADVQNGHKELDITLAYSVKNLTVQLADLWWNGQADARYFHWKSHGTRHHLEAGASYTLPCEKFPLTLAWYTVLYGDDRKDISPGCPYGKQAYSSYAELAYPFTVRGIAINAVLGFTPYESQTGGMGYMTTGFAVTNISLKATKEIHFNKKYSLPLFTQLVFNPAHEKAHLVLGFTLR